MTLAPTAAAIATPAQLRDASFQWPGGRGVADINLTVRPGEVLTLLGPNGAGKSTVLKLLSGEISPQQGDVHIFGAVHGSAARRRIGLVLQEPSTDDLMSLQETLELHGRLFGLRGSELQRRCQSLLDSLGLADRAADRCETLSGGLRRRLDIARALLHRPDLLLLDEPTLALDPESSAAIWRTIDERVGGGTAVVVSSNDTTEAEAHADRVIFINDGQFRAEGSPAELSADLRSDAMELDWPAASDADLNELRDWPEVGDVVRADERVLLTVDAASELAPKLFQRFGGDIVGLRIRESSLRDAWFRLVGAPLEPDS